MFTALLSKWSWAAFKELLFSPIGLIVVVIAVWVLSGWKHRLEARFECNQRIAALEASFERAVEDARKFDEDRLHMARVQAERDKQENAEREAAARKEIEDYAKQLKDRCVLGPDGARAVGVR